METFIVTSGWLTDDELNWFVPAWMEPVKIDTTIWEDYKSACAEAAAQVVTLARREYNIKTENLGEVLVIYNEKYMDNPNIHVVLLTEYACENAGLLNESLFYHEYRESRQEQY